MQLQNLQITLEFGGYGTPESVVLILFAVRSHPVGICRLRKEWDAARVRCRVLIYEQMQQRAGRRKKRVTTGVTGGYTDVEDCARGLVSEACRGNNVKYSN